MKSSRITFIAVLLWLLLSIPNVFGQTVVKLVLTPQWDAPFVLTSRMKTPFTTPQVATFPNDDNDNIYEPMTGDDELSYIGIDFYLTTNVEFWTMQIDCTTNASQLQSYAIDTTNATDDTTDDVSPFTLGSVWGVEGTDVVKTAPLFNNVSGTFTLVASRRATTVANNTAPLGANGLEQALYLGKYKMRLKPQVIGTANSTVYRLNPFITCTTTLLDRNGRSVGIVTFVSPTNPVISSGYNLKGNVQYQGQTNHTGIQVTCTDETLVEHDAESDFSGNWTISGLRVDSSYTCQYWANKINPTNFNVEQDAFLGAYAYGNVGPNDFTFLPTKLIAGNVNRPVGVTFGIDVLDIGSITGAFNTSVPSAFATGDANGDLRVDRADLAIVTANLNWSHASGWGLPGDHLLLSAQRNPSTLLNDSRLWLNDGQFNGARVDFYQYMLGTNRDFWASVSPNGAQIAFVRAIGIGSALRYVLHVAPITAGVIGVPVRITPLSGWNFDDLAPSWSPDGTQLAWLCSPVSGSTPTRDFQTNKGSVCVSEASGKNLRVLSPNSKVYPPTWYGGTNVVFGGTSTNATCPNTLCNVKTTTGVVVPLDAQFGTNASAGGTGNDGVEDMPTVRDNWLYYRYDDGNLATNNSLRFVTLSDRANNGATLPLPGTNADGACATTEFHLDVTSGTLDYYTLEQIGLSVYVGSYAVNNGIYTSGTIWSRLAINDYCTVPDPLTAPIWTANPQVFANIVSNTAWDTNPNTPTDLWGLRNTLQWLP